MPDAPSRRSQDSLAERLICMHGELLEDRALMDVNRISIALYEKETGLLKGFLASADSEDSIDLDSMVISLDSMPSLQQLAQTGARRVINNLREAPISSDASRPYRKMILDAGYVSSYTVPMSHQGEFYGFLFFNSKYSNVFTKTMVAHLKSYADMIALTVMRELDAARMVAASVRVMQKVSMARDEETGQHLNRMAHYSRLIANGLPDRHKVSVEFAEFVFLFAPMHDVGKIAIADAILLKPGRLTGEEYAIMQTHVEEGVKIVDMMHDSFGLNMVANFGILRNIVAYHHESLDGKGYPYGKVGAEIPLEARIVAVADVFDALTSKRPYKEAWSNERAFALLQEEAESRFDVDCVAALMAASDQVVDIQARYADI